MQSNTRCGGLFIQLLLIIAIPLITSSKARRSESPHQNSCELNSLIHYKTTRACEGRQIDLSCDEGKIIHLVRANYGRYSYGQLDLSVNCMSFRSFLIMRDRCSKSSNCSVVVSSKLFGDPWPLSSKFLEVQYYCESRDDETDENNSGDQGAGSGDREEGSGDQEEGDEFIEDDEDHG